MDNEKLLKLNNFINNSYECFSFAEFLKLSILKLHELVMYDSGMFFCGISKDCSFFKPYIGGPIEAYYKKQSFAEVDEYINNKQSNGAGNEAYVYKSNDYMHGIVNIVNEPRSSFLKLQEDFHIACLRIVYKGQFLGEIYLHRSKEKPDFDDEDLFALRLMQPHVSTIFNIIHTITAVKYLEANNIPGNRMGICVFDGDMSLIAGNLTGVEMLKNVTVFGSSVLYHLKEQCSFIGADETIKASDNALFDSRILKTLHGDMRIDTFYKINRSMSKEIRYVALLQYCDEDQIAADYKFKFTKREADIIDGLIQGKNNSQLAESLGISENTIKTHVQSIYKKTGANNRTELTYMLMLNDTSFSAK